MAHALHQLIRTEMDARGWKQADLVRASGLTRAHVSKLLKDKRPRLPEPPKRTTVKGLARAFVMPEQSVWQVVAKAMGLPVETLPNVVHELRDASTDSLLDELNRRLRGGAKNRTTIADAVERELGGGRKSPDPEPTPDASDEPHQGETA